MKIKNSIRPLIKFIVGDGRDIFLWFDSWMPLGSIIPTMSDQIILDSGLPRNSRVQAIIDFASNTWRWPLANTPELITLKESIPDAMLPCADRKDVAVWSPFSSGLFFTKSTWNAMRSPSSTVSWSRIVWFPG